MSYHVGGQIAQVDDVAAGKSETFQWDGLALIQRNEVNYVNEPAITGGNPIVADGKALFDDMLGSTLGVVKSSGFEAIDRTAVGETKSNSDFNFFTGKPEIEGLGYNFLLRNYQAGNGKWTTSDPLGYPDGWNNLAYVNNGVTSAIDWLGGEIVTIWVPEGESYLSDQHRNTRTHTHDGQECTVYDLFSARFHDGTLLSYETTRSTWGEVADYLNNISQGVLLGTVAAQGYAFVVVPRFADDALVLPFTIGATGLEIATEIFQNMTGYVTIYKGSQPETRRLTEWINRGEVHSVQE